MAEPRTTSMPASMMSAPSTPAPASTPSYAQVTTHRPTRVEVDLGAIRHNVARLRELAGVDVCAVVKADAYGHGAVPVARAAVDAGASWLAVALVEEGVQLRDAGIEAPILLLSEPPVAAVPELLAARLTPTVYRAPFIAALDAAGHVRGRPVEVHVKLDTGMGRVGIAPGDRAERLGQIARAGGLEVIGLFTHLARADELDVATTGEQLAGFDGALAEAARLGLRPRWRHAANTAAALAHPASRYDLIRPGIGIYGLSPGSDVAAAPYGLVPALRMITEVAYAKRVPAGTAISYGHRWRAPSDGWVATLPVGYADGVPRALTNRGQVLLRGRRRAMAGTVTMDQLLIWCGDDEPLVGEQVVLLGAQEPGVDRWVATAAAAGMADAGVGGGGGPGVGGSGSGGPGGSGVGGSGDGASSEGGSAPVPAPVPDTPAGPPELIRVEEWAEAAGTITYEIVTQLTARLPRHHLG